LWRIENELDWRENHGPRWTENDVRKQREPVVHAPTAGGATTEMTKQFLRDHV
jgi:hypothetical protein